MSTDEKTDEAIAKLVGRDRCDLCHTEGPDKRTLKFSCLYNAQEAVPELVDVGPLYLLRLCKFCRSRLLTMMQAWRDEAVARRGSKVDEDGCPEARPGAFIPYRIFGATYMLTEDEYRKLRGA